MAQKEDIGSYAFMKIRVKAKLPAGKTGLSMGQDPTSVISVVGL